MVITLKIVSVGNQVPNRLSRQCTVTAARNIKKPQVGKATVYYSYIYHVSVNYIILIFRNSNLTFFTVLFRCFFFKVAINKQISYYRISLVVKQL